MEIKYNTSKIVEKTTSTQSISTNAESLQQEFVWLLQVLQTRFALYFGQETSFSSIYDIPIPDISTHKSVYTRIVRHYKMSIDERLVLLLALSPHICPQILDIFFTKNENYNRGFTEFGGVKGNQHCGFIPTGETAVFVLSAGDLSHRFAVTDLFDPDHFFVKHKILNLEKDRSNEPILSGRLSISREYLSLFSTGKEYKPTFSSEFPAQPITTKLEWADLVLEHHILDEVNEIMAWIEHKNTLMVKWNLQKTIKPGFRSLFYGPPGTGKTLTASLLGKSTKLSVYRVDISKVVSKYIGETEKNLANIFDQAEHRDWILFFDEADAIFGKRSAGGDSKDRYANQEIAYLLQRIEEFPGVVILATNLKKNMDEAFARRFQSMIYFPMPKPQQRLTLWRNAFEGRKLAEDVDLKQVSEDYELPGGAIINVLRYCALNAVRREGQAITNHDIIYGIRKELKKEGKTL